MQSPKFLHHIPGKTGRRVKSHLRASVQLGQQFLVCNWLGTLIEAAQKLVGDSSAVLGRKLQGVGKYLSGLSRHGVSFVVIVHVYPRPFSRCAKRPRQYFGSSAVKVIGSFVTG